MHNRIPKSRFCRITSACGDQSGLPGEQGLEEGIVLVAELRCKACLC